MRRLRSANSMGAARLLLVRILRTSLSRWMTWINSPNTLRKKVIRYQMDHIRPTAVELLSLTHRKGTRSNLLSGVRNKLFRGILVSQLRQAVIETHFVRVV